MGAADETDAAERGEEGDCSAAIVAGSYEGKGAMERKLIVVGRTVRTVRTDGGSWKSEQIPERHPSRVQHTEPRIDHAEDAPHRCVADKHRDTIRPRRSSHDARRSEGQHGRPRHACPPRQQKGDGRRDGWRMADADGDYDYDGNATLQRNPRRPPRPLTTWTLAIPIGCAI